MRWIIAVLGVPFLLLLGLAQTFQTTPPPAIPSSAIPIPGALARTPTTPIPTPGVLSPSGSDTLDHLVSAARSWLGTPYLFGGCSRRGIDCSCFVETVLAVIGIHVPRTTVTQKAFDMPVARDQLAPGDTLFFDNTCTNCGADPTHEGMVVSANPPLMIEAGDPVQITSFDTSYWRAHYDSAGRPPGL